VSKFIFISKHITANICYIFKDTAFRKVCISLNDVHDHLNLKKSSHIRLLGSFLSCLVGTAGCYISQRESNIGKRHILTQDIPGTTNRFQ